jgi:hypothetical protein
MNDDDMKKKLDECREVVNRLLNDYLPAINESIGELRSQMLNEVIPPIRESIRRLNEQMVILFGRGGTGTRRTVNKYPRNYEDYLRVIKLVDRGVSVNRAAKLLQLPYSTCYSYSLMTPEQAEALRINRPYREDLPVGPTTPTDGTKGGPGSKGDDSGS